MAREIGKKYSNCTFSGYASQQDVEDHVSRNYQWVPAEVEKINNSSDYMVYFEDRNGEVYKPELASLVADDEMFEMIKKVASKDQELTVEERNLLLVGDNKAIKQ